MSEAPTEQAAAATEVAPKTVLDEATGE